MARRRKKSKPTTRAQSTNSNGSGPGSHVLDKSLPALPSDSLAEDQDLPGSGNSGTPSERFNGQDTVRPRGAGSKVDNRREAMAPVLEEHKGMDTRLGKGLLVPSNRKLIFAENLGLLSRTYSNRRLSRPSSQGDESGNSAEGSLIPVTYDPGLSNQSFSQSLSGNGRSAEGLEEEVFLRENFKDLVAGSSLARATSTERRSPDSRASPHIASQELRAPSSSGMPHNLRRSKEASSNSTSGGASPSTVVDRTPSQRQYANAAGDADRDPFRLQEPPKTRLSGSKRDSEASSLEASPNMALASQTDGSPILETGVAMNFGVDESAGPQAPSVPRRRGSFKKSPLSNPSDVPATAGERLHREDHHHHARPIAQLQIPRKEAPRPEPEASAGATPPAHARKASSARPDQSTLGDRNISSPMNVSGSTDAFEPPPRSSSRHSRGSARRDASENDEFTAPREAPIPPRPLNKTNDSSSSLHSEQLEIRDAVSPMPNYDALGNHFAEAVDEEAMAPNLIRKVSKVVRHGRSHSDKIGTSASPKWQKSRNGSVDISSPIMATVDGREDSTHLRNKLRFSQQRVAELESEKNLLEEQVNGTVNIRQVNSELREKRSTMDFLESQHLVVITELETMTNHLAKAKESNRPVDADVLKNEVLQDFANAMSKLKARLTGQIEELVHKKNELNGEIMNLISMKDKGFLEFESLSNKNSQLTEMNNQLIRNIQDLYKQSRQQSASTVSTASSATPAVANGLGIYTLNHLKEKPESPLDIRGALQMDSSTSHLSGETEVDHASPMNASPINIRKAQPKKFNWKKGSESMAKNVKKGFKGAFGSTSTSTLREEPFTESIPYGALQSGDAPTIGDKPATARMGSNDGRQPAQGWNALAQRGGATIKGGVKEVRDALVSSLPADGSKLSHGNGLLLLYWD